MHANSVVRKTRYIVNGVDAGVSTERSEGLQESETCEKKGTKRVDCTSLLHIVCISRCISSLYFTTDNRNIRHLLNHLLLDTALHTDKQNNDQVNGLSLGVGGCPSNIQQMSVRVDKLFSYKSH